MRSLFHALCAALTAFLIVAAISQATGCATLRGALRTVDDVAIATCELFGTEHPQEFKHLVRNVAPPGVSAADLEKAEIGVRELCGLKEVLQPFIDDQLRLQQSTAAGLRAQMGGGVDAAPPK